MGAALFKAGGGPAGMVSSRLETVIGTESIACDLYSPPLRLDIWSVCVGFFLNLN